MIFAIPVNGDDDPVPGGGIVAVDNKIEQAMDLVESHLMYTVREVEVLKEYIKKLVERISLFEQETALLKSLSNSDQLSQLLQTVAAQPPQSMHPPQQPNVSSV
uniref:Uncharacterized protein n=1 Tax=Castor canadensis TaxID=51338 RepID=A0A8C0WXI6_CASCN